MRKIFLLVNPVFVHHTRRDLPRILTALQHAGISVEMRETTVDRTAGALAAKVAASGAVDAVVVCGGDGTVFDVIQGMAGRETPLGIIPFGTGNILAQNLGIPRSPEAAAKVLAAGRVRTMPLGRLTCGSEADAPSWLFAMSAGMGSHAAMMLAARRSRKNAAGRAAYYVAGLRILLAAPLRPFEIEIVTTEDRVLVRQVTEALALRVSKLNVWRPGGGLELPFLRLASIAAGPRSHLARAAFDSLVRAAGDRARRPPLRSPAIYEDVLRVTCRPLAGDCAAEPIPVQADGEVLGHSCARIEMAGKNLRVITGII